MTYSGRVSGREEGQCDKENHAKKWRQALGIMTHVDNNECDKSQNGNYGGTPEKQIKDKFMVQ